MKNFALIKNGVVDNIIVGEDDYEAPEGYIAVDVTNNTLVGIGNTYNGSVFSNGNQGTNPIQLLYDTMVNDVITEMKAVFGTANPESAAANHQTFLLMQTKPEIFSGEGILADKATTSFILGAALNTDQKVMDYAAERLVEIEAYGIYRIKRIQQFQSDKAAILSQ